MKRGEDSHATPRRTAVALRRVLRSRARRPLVRRVACGLGWAVAVLYFSFVAAVLTLRYAVLPQIEHYRPAIERMAGEALGLHVSIGRIEASWAGINPDLTLFDVRVDDAAGRPALAFSRVETVLSWWSVPAARLRLRVLRIDAPALHLRRDEAGRYFVAGIPLQADGGDGSAAEWVLAQRRIRINGATLVWEDALRGAPALVLEDVNIALDNDGRQHRFALTALPPEGFASRIDVRGDFRGADLEAIDTWSGQMYAEIDYTDLAVWQQWVDYPVVLPRGRGALRTWLGLERGALREVTADLALQDVHLQLSPELPVLALERMSGRLHTRFNPEGMSLKGRAVTLLTQSSQAAGDGGAIHLEPSDFDLEWQSTREAGVTVGAASVSRMDLVALSRLSGFLPLDAHSRTLLRDYAPRGRVSALSARWKGNAEGMETYALKANVQDLGVRAQGRFPGFSGISGSVEASDKGGKAILRSGASTVDLPAVFPETPIRLDSLSAQASWKLHQGRLEAELAYADFAGPDAAGSARGTYRTVPDSPGVIDMSAVLTRADARAVWRYMPHVVGAGARQWLHTSLQAGKATEARLVLKGDLKDFPFVDKRLGQFLVTVKARDAVLDYGEGWPRIEGIAGDLRFEGNGMTIDAQRGRIFGARLSNTEVRIPDFHVPISTLYIKGRAEGPTADFLKFVDQSPVAARIDRFTEALRAAGQGRLDIDLTIPLDARHLDESQVAGTYRFTNNEVSVDPALPPLRQVNGSLRFTGSGLEIPEITASLFGGPLKIHGGTQPDGRVSITANGTADLTQFRKQADFPWLSGLSGSTPYRGEIRVNKGVADVVVESTLTGLSSTLPEPFAKPSGEAWPLRFEKKTLPSVAGRGDSSVREQIAVSLGSLASAQFVRRKGNDGSVLERGALAVGRTLALPERGFVAAIAARRIDLDAWQKVLASPTQASGGDTAAPGPDSLVLQAGEMTVHGLRWNDVDLTATAGPRQWKIRLNARQAAGDVLWESEGSGRLTMRLSRLVLDPPTSAVGSAVAENGGERSGRLPALDVVAERFSLRQRDLGRLELQAANEGTAWNLGRIALSSPHGSFSGHGSWQGGATGRTQIAFKLESGDAGALLGQLGYPGSVRGGRAQFDGRLNWVGSPVEPDLASLNGELAVEAEKGQFLKLDPGAAGKLIGLFSLQNLPRRITLDFKDVFSNGFVFDDIQGKFSVLRGTMSTGHLQIDGPQARIVMRGEVDLKRETQRLYVNVRPEIGETAALGVALVNPAAGAATWLANKVLKNPLSGLFGYNYLVSGSWDDPKVEKLSAREVQEDQAGTGEGRNEPASPR